MPKTKLIIAGTKKITNELVTYQAINEWKLNNQDKSIGVIISGRIRGPETHAIQYANNNNISYIEFTPDWDSHGKNAVLIRNAHMAKDGDELIAIYDGKSKTANHMIDTMLTLNKPVWVYDTSHLPQQLRRII
jgi:hypothetical protein